MKRLSKGSGISKIIEFLSMESRWKTEKLQKNTSGIEHLIEREYLERDKNQALCFHKNLQRVLSS